MRRIEILLMACSVLALGVGCDDGRDPDITLMDSGPSGTDSGTTMGTDSGTTMGTDSGTTATCSVSGIMPLPSACLPRCASSTVSAVNACFMMDASTEDVLACRDAALQADPTPSVEVTTPGMPIDGDCEFCWGWQTNVAIAGECPSEFEAYLMCANMMGADCSSQEAALDSCIMTNEAAINTQFQSLIMQCFGTGSGFLPGFRTSLQLPSSYPIDLYMSIARRFYH
jgi:hypothetical protein